MNTLYINLFGGPGVGKCFGKDTKILMFDGTTKNVQDIQPGEYLMGVDSKPRTVVSTTQGFGELWEIIPTKGHPFIVNSEHILSVTYNKHGKEKILNLSVKDYLKQSSSMQDRQKLYRVGIEFPSKNLNIDPYFLGLWLGDGCANSISITNMDETILDYVRNIAKRYNLLCRKYKYNSIATLKLTNGQRGGKSHPLLDYYKEYNLFGNKHIPDIYKFNSQQNRLLLLAGLIDTDGSISNNCFEIIQKSFTLSEDIIWLARSVGLAAYKSTKNIKGTKYNRIIISGDIQRIPTQLKHKKAEPRQQRKNVLRTGFTVKKINCGSYFGFELDGDKLFCLSDFTVVHNSTTAAGVFYNLKKKQLRAEYVSEWAKEKVWGDQVAILDDQLYVLAKQHHKCNILRGKVQFVVSDSPLLLSLVYASPEANTKAFQDYVIERFNSFRNLNFLLVRNKKYDEVGRLQTEEEARSVDETVKEVLYKHQIHHIVLHENDDVAEQVVQYAIDFIS